MAVETNDALSRLGSLSLLRLRLERLLLLQKPEVVWLDESMSLGIAKSGMKYQLDYDLPVLKREWWPLGAAVRRQH